MRVRVPPLLPLPPDPAVPPLAEKPPPPVTTPPAAPPEDAATAELTEEATWVIVGRWTESI